MTKEKVYDNQINPLMARIIKICQKHKIAMLADFALDEDLACTTALLTAEFSPNENQIEALRILKRKPFMMAETIKTKPDGSKHITLRRITLRRIS